MGEIPIIGRGKPGPKPGPQPHPKGKSDPTKPNPVYYKMNLLQQCGEFYAGAARSYENAGLDEEAKTSFKEAGVKFWQAAQIVEEFIAENDKLIQGEVE